MRLEKILTRTLTLHRDAGRFSIVVPSGRTMAERVVAAGGQLARPLVDGANFVKDPDGYTIELYQRPAAPAK